MRQVSVAAASCVVLVLLTWPTGACAFTPGNILFSGGMSIREVREYTPAGTLVRTIPVPAHPSSEQLRDLVLDHNDVLHVYHGTFNPLLRSYTGIWSSHTFANWSTVNNITYGGIAATSDFVFVTDMDHSGFSGRGIIRFDTSAGYAAVRFADTQDYIDLTVGLDCRLYALRPPEASTQTVDVFDPLTLASYGSVVLTLGGPAPDLRGIAVTSTGEIFAAALDQNIYHFDTGGNVVDSLATGGWLTDLNLTTDGDLVAAQWMGQIVLTTTALSSFSTIDPGVANFFVAWVGGEQPPSCTACFSQQDLTADQWRMISLPCFVGASDRVADVFGDDLDELDYGVRWGLFERDEVAQAYYLLGLGDSLNEGEGYWITTLDAGQSVTVSGTKSTAIDVALSADAVSGVQNLVGHPFDFDVCWADVEVVDGASVLSLDQADPLIVSVRACEMVPPDPSCVMSRVAHQWNGAAYEAFDGETAGMQGTLREFDGIWVKAYKPGIALRIPETPGTGCTFCFPDPVAEAGTDQTICLGETATIGTAAQPGHSYSWSPGGATTAQVEVSPAVTTTYTLTASTICGSAQDLVTVTVDDGSGGFEDDFEGDLAGWTTSGLWHLADSSPCFSPTAGYNSPTHGFYYGQDATCNFNVGTTAGLLTSPPITGISAASELTFQYLRDAEQSVSYDRTEVRIVHQTGTDTVLSLTLNRSLWTLAGPISLAAYAGQAIQVQFSFNSVDGGVNTGAGWLIDDVSVSTSSPCAPPLASAVAATLETSLKASAGRNNDPRNWTVRLVVEADDLRDAGSVFGQLSDARDGYDYHDLPEPAPFGERYLSVVFPHADWNEHAGNYTSDFQAPDPPLRGEWRFDVVGAGFTGPVTLRWASENRPLRGMFLVDEATCERIRIEPFGSYTFELEGSELNGGRRSFRWIHGNVKLPSVAEADSSSPKWSATDTPRRR